MFGSKCCRLEGKPVTSHSLSVRNSQPVTRQKGMTGKEGGGDYAFAAFRLKLPQAERTDAAGGHNTASAHR